MKTTSYEISRKLFEAGFKPDNEDDLKWYAGPTTNDTACPAYDLETILEALPEMIVLHGISHELNIYKNYLVYERATGAGQYECNKEDNESLADTAARLLILLVEKGIVKFNN